MKKFICGSLLTIAVLFSGCFRYENIELKSVKDFTYQEFKDNVLKLKATLVINNPNKLKIKIKNANLSLVYNDNEIGKVTQMEHIELSGKTEKDYPLYFAIELGNITSTLPALFRILMNESSKLYLSGSLQVKSFLYTKTYYIDKLPLGKEPGYITVKK